MKGLKGKTVVVTGASSGIGEALARECAVQGANVVLGARSLQKLQLIVGDIRSKGGEATYCAVDVTKPEECRNLIDTAVGEYGGLDVLICNAGLSMRALFDDVDLEVLHRLMTLISGARSIVPNTRCRTCRLRTGRWSASRRWPVCTACRGVRAIRLRNMR